MRTPWIEPTRTLALVLALLVAACGARSVAPDDVATPRADAPSDDGYPVFILDGRGAACTRNAQCDDGLYCNGAEACLDGACVAGAAPCDDRVACTGDVCVEATRACVRAPRDRDGDGHVDAACGGDDCDDTNPAVHPGAAEVCTNGIDDDCNGLVDGADPACASGAGTSCATAVALPGPGTWAGTTVAHDDRVGDVCPGVIGVDAVAIYTFTLAAPTVVTATLTAADDVSLKLAIATSCAPFAGRVCASALEPMAGHSPVALTASLAAGTYWLAVDLQGPEAFTLDLAYGPATTAATYALSTPTIPFVDVCALAGHGTALSMADDVTVALPTATDAAPATLPFALRLANVDAAPPLSVSSNGWLALAPTSAVTTSPLMPSPDAPNLTLAGFWLDLFTRDPGVCYATVGTAPTRRFVVEWADTALFAVSDAHVTFEIAIDEAPPGVNNTIDVVYQHVSERTPPGVGVENATGTAAVQYTGPVTDGLALRFTPLPR